MPKILLIDDDPDFIESSKIVLASSGYEIISALNGEEGLEKIASEKPDLVVLDIMMTTEFEGFEVARKIREDMKLHDLPIIILSSIHEAKKVPYRFAPDDTWLPVDLWLDKPVDPDVLLEKVKTALGDMPQLPG